MSRIFKRPKSYVNQGNIQARNIKSARLIEDQEQLDRIIAAQPDSAIAEAWLSLYGPHMRFTPQTFKEIQLRLSPETVAT